MKTILKIGHRVAFLLSNNFLTLFNDCSNVNDFPPDLTWMRQIVANQNNQLDGKKNLLRKR